MADVLTQLWRGTVLGTGGLVIGLACFVIWRYGRGLRSGGDPVPKHVVMIATSYVLFRAIGFADQFDLFEHNAPLTWRLVVFSLGDALGIVALRIILRAAVRR